jgi:hypothetical protein
MMNIVVRFFTASVQVNLAVSPKVLRTFLIKKIAFDATKRSVFSGFSLGNVTGFSNNSLYLLPNFSTKLK